MKLRPRQACPGTRKDGDLIVVMDDMKYLLAAYEWSGRIRSHVQNLLRSCQDAAHGFAALPQCGFPGEGFIPVAKKLGRATQFNGGSADNDFSSGMAVLVAAAHLKNQCAHWLQSCHASYVNIEFRCCGG